MEPVAGSEATSAAPLRPRVSICTSVLNQSEWLKESIASVVASSYADWELLIVDDGSTEDIKAVVDSFNDERIKFFKFEQNRGIPHGSNFLISKAAGEYICILAADEWIWEKKLEVQVAYLDEHQQVDCVWGLPGRYNQQPITGEMGPRPEWEQVALRAHNRSREAWLRTLVNLEAIPIGGCSFMMRKRVMDELGGFDPNLTVFSDHELYCRFFEKYVGVILPYLFARDKDATTGCVRAQNEDKWAKEIEYVKARHPVITPPVTGKVTIAIPCYNHAKYLPAAVASALAQTHQVDEIMILNDCSTDDFNTVAQQFTDPRIKLLAFDENRGMTEAHNQMAYRAQGDFIAFLSADDTLEPTYIEKCLAMFKANPWLEFVASQNDFMNEDGSAFTPKNDFEKQVLLIPKARNYASREQWLEVLRAGNQYFGSGMYRTKVISEVGGWEKEFKVIADYQMYLKLLTRETIGIVEEPLTHTRIHEANHSKLNEERARELPWLYHAARKPIYRQLMKLVIATPFYEVKAFSPYIVALTQSIRLLTQMGIDWRFMDLSGDSYVHRARNTICDVFLQDPDATDLFFIDSDMSWNPEALVNMCLLPEEVVGGSYPVKNGWDQWTSIPKLTEENGQHHLKGRALQDGSALVEARVLAGGFLRIKRSALLKFRENYPDLWYREPSTDPSMPERQYTSFFTAESIDHQFIGEDHAFSKRLREMGMPMYIYPNATIEHWGAQGHKGNFDHWLRDQKKVQAAASDSAQVATVRH
jgi:glycosyltransferase involved in cell wall biosynthesis